MLVKGVVFDLDHTLYDRYATLCAIAPDFVCEMKDCISPRLSEDAAANLLCEGDRRYIYFGWRRIFAYLCEMGMFANPPEYERYKETLLRLYTVHAVPYPFTYSVLSSLRERGLKTGLITNGRAEVQDCKLRLLKLEDAFDEVLLCGEFGVQKPDRAPFDEMARRLGEANETLLYVGDNPTCDIEGARNAGYIPVEVLTAGCVLPEAVPAKYRIRSVEELDKMLKVIADD